MDKAKNKLFSSSFEFLILTPERIENIIGEMIKTGKIKENEAEKMRNSLMKKSDKERKTFLNDLDTYIENKIKSLDYVPKKEIDKLKTKVRSLETYIDDQARTLKTLSS